jgi:hypothetical protein
LNAIDGIVVALGAEGRVVDSVALANHLSITYGQSGLSRKEIIREIERTAAAKGVPLLSGNQAA